MKPIYKPKKVYYALRDMHKGRYHVTVFWKNAYGYYAISELFPKNTTFEGIEKTIREIGCLPSTTILERTSYVSFSMSV